MPSAKITYDSGLRSSEHGQRLYAYWRRIRRRAFHPDFERYPDFFKWAMANGYTVGAKLFKHDETEPYSPENCFWVPRDEWAAETKQETRSPEREREWDKVVNRIRLHFGMEPIHSSEV